MKVENKKKVKKVNFEAKRVYVGQKPIEEVFEDIIEHVVERNLEKDRENKQTQV